jgi:hypothetical protein
LQRVSAPDKFRIPKLRSWSRELSKRRLATAPYLCLSHSWMRSWLYSELRRSRCALAAQLAEKGVLRRWLDHSRKFADRMTLTGCRKKKASLSTRCTSACTPVCARMRSVLHRWLHNWMSYHLLVVLYNQSGRVTKIGYTTRDVIKLVQSCGRYSGAQARKRLIVVVDA